MDPRIVLRYPHVFSEFWVLHLDTLEEALQENNVTSGSYAPTKKHPL